MTAVMAPPPAPPRTDGPDRLRRPSGARPRGRVGWGDRLFRWACQVAAWSVIVLASLLVIVLAWKSSLALRTVGLSFFTGRTWDPEPEHRIFGALPFIYGTVATSLVAMLIAVPLGVGTAAYLSEIAPGWLRRGGSFLVEMLAAIPSVVYGFWGLYVLAPIFGALVTRLGGPNTGGGVGVLAASLVLAIMIVPYVAAVSFDVCRAVPTSQREAALALGATRWQTIWSVVLPYARPGILGGCFLALGRALGETMAVTMLIGNRPEIKFFPVPFRGLSPFALGNSMASVIANEFTEATYDLYLSALVAMGLTLLAVSVIVNSLARLLIWRVTRVRSSASFRRNRRLTPALPAHAGAGPGRLQAQNRTTARWANRVMTGVLLGSLVVTTVPLFLILGYLIYRGVGSLNWAFFTNLPAPVGEAGGGMANALVGSLMLVGLASALAVPLGILAAIYLAEYRSDRLGPAVRFVAELLAGVPSIVIGIFAYTVVVVPSGHFSGWAGSFALAVMMLPVVIRASEESLKLVPRPLRNASHALGASQWQTVTRVVVPAALPAIITAVFLAVARVGGETAPLLLTALSNQYWPTSPNDYTPSLPVYVFNYATGPYADQHRQAWAAALVLVVAVMLLNFGVRVLTGRRVVLAGRAD